ncbi:MAG: hypothetical protein KF861_08825 [Planctomycetaceae bacterium]|nr:hypothetical protein [Planctomycetaceae bacterium]
MDGLQLQLQELLSERNELLTRLHESQLQNAATAQRQAIESLLAESGLPDYAVTATFRRLLAAADPASRIELVQERVRLIADAHRRPPLSHERAPDRDSALSDAAFIALLKPHR